MFGSIQYTYGVAKSLENYYTTILATQQMQQNTPFESAALSAAAWVGILHGFNTASKHLLANESLQQFPDVGEVQFNYDTSVVPNRSSAYFKKELSLLEDFFVGFGSGLGLTKLSTAAQMGGTSPPSFVSVHADVSISMEGPGDTATVPAIQEMLQKANIPVTTNTGAYCYPINIADAAVVYPLWWSAGAGSVPRRWAMQKRCDDYRSKLPFYHTGQVGVPINFNFYFKPYPDPYDENTDWRRGGHAYNPGLDYSNPTNAPANHNMLTDGTYIFKTGGDCLGGTSPCVCGQSVGGSTVDCFPLATPADQFSLLYREGYRLVHYDQLDPSCQTNNDYECIPIPRYPKMPGDMTSDLEDPAEPFFGWATDRLFITRAWSYGLSYMTQRELNACQGATTGPETPPTDGCDPQRGMLNVYLGDFFRSYLKLTQAFMISLSETVPLINFSVFSGATFWGFISNHVVGTTKPPSANKKIYDSTQYSSGTIYDNSVDEALRDLVIVNIQKTGGGTQYIPNNLSYVHTPAIRLMEQTAYMDRAFFPDINPDPTVPGWLSSLAAADTSYPLAQWMAPLENPNRPFVEESRYVPMQKPIGRAATYHLKAPGTHPSEQYDWPFYWENFTQGVPPAPQYFFPPPAPQVINPVASTFWTGSNSSAYLTDYDGRYDVKPLKQIDYANGQQTGNPYVAEDWIKNLAMSVFNYLTPSSGGTGTLDALIDACDSYKVISGGTGANCGGPSSLPGVVLVISDGKPNQPCADTILPSYLSCDNTYESNYTLLLSRIQEKLDHLEQSGLFVILLYIDHPSLSSDPEVTQFKNLFLGNPHRVMVSFSFGSTSQFTANFKGSLSIVKSLIMQHTRQILP